MAEIQSSPSSYPGQHQARPNTAMAEIVDRAIALMDEFGKDYASQYLIGQGIGFRIIDRVLADPQFRRPPRKVETT